ncbi:MAG: hypothetical protein ACYTEX_26845 [Planctomycetota bacterium]
MKGWLIWGVCGYGRRHYMCRFCREEFGTDDNGLKFEDDIEHHCDVVDSNKEYRHEERE